MRKKRNALLQNTATTGVAHCAVRINHARWLGRVVGGGSVTGRMIVLMMAKVLRRYPTFVLAITRRCSPTELHRQEKNQKDEKPTAHGAASVAAHFP